MRQLGRTGIEVSAYCLGAMMFGPNGNPDHNACTRMDAPSSNARMRRVPGHPTDPRRLDAVEQLIPHAEQAGLQLTHLMRRTVHLVTATDALTWRACFPASTPPMSLNPPEPQHSCLQVRHS
nr:aldo/keto reductase [Streptomyces tsukubensis NRRL18488]